jgi:hypothetical protein
MTVSRAGHGSMVVGWLARLPRLLALPAPGRQPSDRCRETSAIHNHGVRRKARARAALEGSPAAAALCSAFGPPTLLPPPPPPPAEDKLEDVLVTPDFDVQPSPLSEYYVHLDQRLEELQNLMGSQGAVLPSTYEKYLHGNVPAGVTGNPLVSAKEYYEQLKQLRADSQVYYPVAPEVYRDLLWEDVDVADPVEYTFCRYTPITTEVRQGVERCAVLWTLLPPWSLQETSHPRHVAGAVPPRCGASCAPLLVCARSAPLLLPQYCRRMRVTLGATATRCACSTSSAATSSCSFASRCTTKTRTRSARRCWASARCGCGGAGPAPARSNVWSTNQHVCC